jgi:hypothetical protein
MEKKKKMSEHYRIDLSKRLLDKAKENRRENIVGRYSISKIWAINNNYLSPKQYLEGEEIDFLGAFRMWQGVSKHRQLEELLKDDYQVEQKKEMEIEIDDEKFTIVGVADILDFIDKKDVCDFKTSQELKVAKRWDLAQVQIYATLFEKPKGYILQPRYTKDAFWVEIIGQVERNDDFFWAEMKKLCRFHKALKKVAK